MIKGINALRRELTEICAQVETRRPPAIRRSLQEQYLYATDLPLAADDSAVDRFIELASGAGWQVSAEAGWLQLDRIITVPLSDWNTDQYGPESACCLTILRRNAGRLNPSDGTVERQLIKAADQGTDAYEVCCRKIHRDWAERLRTGNAIPDVHPGFFGRKAAIQSSDD